MFLHHLHRALRSVDRIRKERRLRQGTPKAPARSLVSPTQERGTLHVQFEWSTGFPAEVPLTSSPVVSRLNRSTGSNIRSAYVPSLLTLAFDTSVQYVDFSASSPSFLDQVLVVLTLVLLVETW